MTFLATGIIKVSFTNLQTGKTITENVSGPDKVTVSPDGSAILAAKGRTGNVFTLANAFWAEGRPGRQADGALPGRCRRWPAGHGMDRWPPFRPCGRGQGRTIIQFGRRAGQLWRASVPVARHEHAPKEGER